jgi:hypothetical protein
MIASIAARRHCANASTVPSRRLRTQPAASSARLDHRVAVSDTRTLPE